MKTKLGLATAKLRILGSFGPKCCQKVDNTSFLDVCAPLVRALKKYLEPTSELEDSNETLSLKPENSRVQRITEEDIEKNQLNQ